MSLSKDLQDRLVLPVMIAPMFLCTGVDLVAEGCKAGLIGTLTRNHCRTDDEFENQILAVREQTARFRDRSPQCRVGPLAANISVNTDPTALRNSVEICRKHGVEIVVTAGGDPTTVAAKVHEWGGLIYHDATSMRFAEKAIKAGVDGIIAIGAGGGGHSGTLSHLTFIPKVREIFDGTIVAAGTVTDGAAIRACEILGADLCYMGTRFIATQESIAPDEYKALLVSQGPADLVYTGAVNGVPAMWLLESMRRNKVLVDELLTGRLPAAEAIPPEVTPWRNLWSAGQGIGLIHDLPRVADLVERLKEEYLRSATMPSVFAGR